MKKRWKKSWGGRHFAEAAREEHQRKSWDDWTLSLSEQQMTERNETAATWIYKEDEDGQEETRESSVMMDGMQRGEIENDGQAPRHQKSGLGEKEKTQQNRYGHSLCHGHASIVICDEQHGEQAVGEQEACCCYCRRCGQGDDAGERHGVDAGVGGDRGIAVHLRNDTAFYGPRDGREPLQAAYGKPGTASWAQNYGTTFWKFRAIRADTSVNNLLYRDDFLVQTCTGDPKMVLRPRDKLWPTSLFYFVLLGGKL